MSAREMVALIQQRLGAADFAGFADLFADEAVFEYPFVVPGWPSVLHGRAAIREHIVDSRRDVRSRIELTGFESTVHETSDPEIVVVEHEALGISVATGEPFRFASGVGVLTVRDGQIVRYRDYANPIGTAIASGRLPELAALMKETA
ncbi:MAG TPA: nuclear transport factor 2 family protein [Pseudonocardiaceae bacterium]|jgi:ketosteroid isomerase-like protein|nr:nuclear transport factor 2 family protein [Pseudonocardiaceae bacterium]